MKKPDLYRNNPYPIDKSLSPLPSKKLMKKTYLLSTALVTLLMFVLNTAHAQINVIAQPVNSTICSGNNTFFAITATGPSITYQWQVNPGTGFVDVTNTGVYSNATTAILNITGGTTTLNGYTYRCLMASSSYADTSDTVVLTVNGLPVIGTDPIASTICAGSNTAFTVAATGTGLNYQWQVNTGSSWVNIANGGVYSNATTSTLDITAATANMNTYQYRCVVSGTCAPNDTSNAVILTVNSLPAIGTEPVAASVCAGSNTSFTLAATGTALTYQWQVNSGSGWSDLTNTGVYSNTTTNTLNITAATAGMNTYQYRCVVGGTCAPNDTSNAVALTVNTLPVIGTEPVASTICEGLNTSFAVVATGTAAAYQWQVNTGSAWVDITNAGVYSNATTATLNITAATASMNAYQYRCIVSGTCTPNDTSNIVALTVNTAPVVSTEPVNTSVCEGSNTSLTLTATGTALTYIWQVNDGTGWANVTNGPLYSNATTNTLNITAAPFSINTYQYRCIVGGTCAPEDTSAVVTLTVNTLPVVVTDPVASTICEGANTSFAITATGTAAAYQWQVNTGSGWTNVANAGVYSNATTATLNITAATASLTTYQYRCIVSGTCTPNDTSAAVALTVNTLPVIGTEPVNATICQNMNTSFTLAATGTALSYLWQVNDGSGWANTTNGSLYSNVTTNTLNITAATVSMNTYQYRCIVSGTCAPNDTSAVVTLTVNMLPKINTDPVSSTICAGNNTSFSVAAVGTAIVYQWQVNDGTGWTNVANAGVYTNATTNALDITAATASMNMYQYRCIVSGTCSPNDTSDVVTLRVNTPSVVTTEPVNTAACLGSNTSFTLASTGTATSFIWQVNTGSGWTFLTNGSTYNNVTTNTLNIASVTMAMDGYQYRCLVMGVCTPDDTSAVVTLTINTLPDITADPVASTICAGNNTSFAVTATGTNAAYQWQVNTGSSWANITNTGVYTNATTNTLNITAATAGMNTYQYRCIVSGACAPNDTSAAVALTVNTPAVIGTEPSNRTICDADNTTFAVAATGSGLAYQWQVNDGSGWADISNTGVYTTATTNTLTITGATVGMTTYQYRCIVSGTCANDTSAEVTLVVNTPAAVTSQAVAQTICAGDNTSFNIVASGTGLTYRWQVNTGSGWSNVSNGGVYSNATTTTLNITAATASMNTYQYRCRISNGCGNLNSTPVTLTVNTPPVITTEPVNTTICEGSNTSLSVVTTGSPITYKWQMDDGTGWVDLANDAIHNNVATATLAITGATVSMTNHQYRCVVNGACSPSDTSNAVILTVNTLPNIVTQPATNIIICEGSNASLNTVATGTGISYQWQVNSGAGFNNISDNATYSGSGTNTLNISSASYTLNNYQYRCVVRGACSPDAMTAIVDMHVNKNTAILSQILADTICEGVNTQLPILAEGTSLTYQWQVNAGSGFTNVINTGIYSGANTNTLSLTAPMGNVNGYIFKCIVNGTCGSQQVTTDIPLTIEYFPTITQQPVDDSVDAGDNVTFSVTATGTHISYQWQVDEKTGTFVDLFDNAVYSGSKTNKLTITNAFQSKNGFTYRCIVAGKCTIPDTSNVALLKVGSPVSVHNVNSNTAGITVYPNPVSGSELMVKMQNAGTGKFNAHIVDQFGRIIKSGSLEFTQGNVARIDVSALVPGVYTLQLSNDKGEQLDITRFTKQ